MAIALLIIQIIQTVTTVLFLVRLTITVQTVIIGIIILIHVPEEIIITTILIGIITATITLIAAIPVHIVVPAEASTAVALEPPAAEEEDTNRIN